MARAKGGTAQSGGKNHTFGGGKGGTKLTRGVTFGRKIAKGRFNSGTNYNLRTDGGDNTLGGFSSHVGSPPPVHPGGKGATKTRFPRIRQPDGYKGGSR